MALTAPAPIRTIAVVMAVVGCFALLGSAGAAEPAMVNSSGPTSAAPGDSVTVSITLTNTGSSEDNYIADVSVPNGWSVDGHTDDSGTWNGGDISWLWQNLGSGSSVTPSLTVTVPNDVDTDSYTIEITAKSSDGVEDTAIHTLSVDSSSDEDTNTDDGSSGGGGGGGPGGSETEPIDEETTEEPANSTESDGKAVDESDEPSPTSTRTELQIADTDADRAGITVETGTDSVDRITFDDESITGTVEITEYQTPPKSATDGIAAAVGGSSDEGTETEPGGDSGDQQTTARATTVVSVTDISPSTESTANTAATVTLTVDRDRLNEPTEAYMMHESDAGWERLETTVEERTDNTVTLEARTESFSLFAVVETTAQPQQDADETQSEPGFEDSLLIRLVGIALLGVLLVSAGLLFRG